MATYTTTQLKDLSAGDRIVSIGHITYRTPRVVLASLSPLSDENPVEGVRLEPLPGGTEDVRYPSQCDGWPIVYERD